MVSPNALHWPRVSLGCARSLARALVMAMILRVGRRLMRFLTGHQVERLLFI